MASEKDKVIELSPRMAAEAEKACQRANVLACAISEFYETLIAGELPTDLAIELTMMWCQGEFSK